MHRSDPCYTFAHGARWLLIILLVLSVATVKAQQSVPFQLHDDIENSIGLSGVRLLGALDLAPMSRRFASVAELSGITWDADENVLYAVTDRGWLLTLAVTFSQQKLATAKLVTQHRLRARNRKYLRGKAADSEGLYARNTNNGIRGDAELLVSFERKPRIVAFRPDGTQIAPVPLAAQLASPDNYQSANKGLESVSVHPTLGVVTAPEWPLRNSDTSFVTFYAADSRSARMPRLDETNAGLVGLHAFDDGSLLTLERAYSWLTLSLVVELAQTSIWRGDPSASTELSRTTLARFDSSLGWRVDNFEGLAHHNGRRFFMVSDDNGSSLQTTLLVYFELL